MAIANQGRTGPPRGLLVDRSHHMPATPVICRCPHCKGHPMRPHWTALERGWMQCTRHNRTVRHSPCMECIEEDQADGSSQQLQPDPR